MMRYCRLTFCEKANQNICCKSCVEECAERCLNDPSVCNCEGKVPLKRDSCFAVARSKKIDPKSKVAKELESIAKKYNTLVEMTISDSDGEPVYTIKIRP